MLAAQAREAFEQRARPRQEHDRAAPRRGEARRVGDVATGVEAFRWCPDGEHIVFISWVWPVRNE